MSKPSFPQHIFITGIGTEIGKTVTSAIFCQALEADYWKPIQAGSLDFTDSHFVQSAITNSQTKTIDEAHLLKAPVSPHVAAARENIHIDVSDIHLPATANRLVVEGAGGVMVPINSDELMLNLILHLDIPVVIVSRNYLGSINHTLLTCEMLNTAGCQILGIIFNGEENKATEEFILNYTNLHCFGRIEQAPQVTPAFVTEQAEKLRNNLSSKFQL
jgi:dethiobiotin synthetase